MKKGIVISIALIGLGFIFECIHFATNIEFFEIKFWALGVISTALGIFGILWYTLIPLLENRAEKLGKFKKKQILKNKNYLS